MTIADEAGITASTNMLLIYMSKEKTFRDFPGVLYAMCVLEAIVPRTCISMMHGLELKSGNKIIVYRLFIDFRWNCACFVNGQWNVELKFPEVFVFPFCWTRVTEALGMRLAFKFNISDIWECPPIQEAHLQGLHWYLIIKETSLSGEIKHATIIK